MRIHAEHAGDVVLLECEGRLVRSDAAFIMRNAVLAEHTAHLLILDFSNLQIVEGGGLGMLVFLQDWTSKRGIQLKIFNPHAWVRNRLEQAPSHFDIATADEITPLLQDAFSHERSSFRHR